MRTRFEMRCQIVLEIGNGGAEMVFLGSREGGSLGMVVGRRMIFLRKCAFLFFRFPGIIIYNESNNP
jgi:hypothetical protein